MELTMQLFLPGFGVNISHNNPDPRLMIQIYFTWMQLNFLTCLIISYILGRWLGMVVL